MRNTRECCEEIFRRSKIRIEKRKRRTARVLAFCIPLCFCVVLWSILVLPAMLPANGKDPMDRGQGESVVVEKEDGEAKEPSFVSATVQDAGETKNVTEPEALYALYEAVSELVFYEIPAADQNTESQKENNAENSKSEMPSLTTKDETSLEIVFYSSDGGESRYVFRENRLCHPESGREAELSKEDLEKILARLN